MNASEDIETRVSEALHHVAALPPGTVEPTPQMSPLRSQRHRPSPSRPRVLAVSFVAAVILVGGTLLAVRASHGHSVVVNGAPSPAGLGTPVTLPKVKVPAGSTPLDYGLLRLYLPPGWTSITECRPVAPSEGDGNEPVPDTYVLIPSSKSTGCLAPTQGDWATVQPMPGPAPTGSATTMVNGIAVWSPPDRADDQQTLDVPSLHVELNAGGSGRSILATLGPSSLDAVLAQRRATPVPSSWKAVRFDGLKVQVPSGWPIDTLTFQVAKPGSCNRPIFRIPIVYLGDNGFTPICPVGFGVNPPVDGVWLGSPAPTQAGNDTHAVSFSQLPAVLTYSDADFQAVVGMQVTVGNHTVYVGIGLGENPALAEEILSSLQAA